MPARLRKPESHKGDYGHLFILGGSPGLTGAVCLAGEAALRSGCGLATVGIPESLNTIIEVKLTEVMSRPLPETAEHTFSLQACEPALAFMDERSDGAVVGPGISLHPQTAQFVTTVLSRTSKPLVVDADALKIIAGRQDVTRQLQHVPIFTPHPGEMSVLMQEKISSVQAHRTEVAGECSRLYGAVVILKGDKTVVTDGTDVYTNFTGNPGMATGGSGDVLAGIVGSFLVQGIPPFEAAKAAVYIHGLAGDLAAKEKGQISLVASDLIAFLPSAFKWWGSLI